MNNDGILLNVPNPCVADVKVNIPITRGSKEINATFISFKNMPGNKEHFAIALGDWENIEVPVVRVHSECMTGDVFMSQRCDCGGQLEEALDLLSEKGGIILYLRQEGRGIGLYGKFAAYKLQDAGFDTYRANTELGFHEDDRDFEIAALMLKSLNITNIYLHTNNMEKQKQLIKAGINVVDIIPTKVHQNPHNEKYLSAKERIAGHRLIKK